MLKNLWLTFLIEKSMYFIMHLQLRLGLKSKKSRVLQFNQSQWLIPDVDFNTQRRMEVEKMETNMEKRCA